MYTESAPLRDCTPLALRHRSRLVSSAVLAGGTHTPVVLCCVLVYTPEPTVRRLRVPDGRRRARVAHAPKAANDEARVFAKSGHPPRPAQHLQDDPAGRIRVATPHGLPVLVCTRVRGQLQKLVHVPAHLTVVPNDQRLHRPERGAKPA